MKTLDTKTTKVIQGGLGNFPGYTAEMDTVVRQFLDAQLQAAGGLPSSAPSVQEMERMIIARGETISNGGATKSSAKPGK